MYFNPNRISRQPVFVTLVYGSTQHQFYKSFSNHHLHNMLGNEPATEAEIQNIVDQSNSYYLSYSRVNFNFHMISCYAKGKVGKIITDYKVPKQVIGVSFVLRDSTGKLCPAGAYNVITLSDASSQVKQNQLDQFLKDEKRDLIREYSQKHGVTIDFLDTTLYQSPVFY